MQKLLATAAVSAVLLLPAAASARQAEPAQGQQGQQMPEMPKPGPEHEMLKKDVGVWDAVVEMTGPDGTRSTSKATETVSMVGFWQVGQFKGEFMGQPFEGLGLVTWDPTKKKYVGSWIDSMTPGQSTVEADYDPARRTMSGTMEGPDMSGKVSRMRETTEWKPDGTRVFTMHAPKGPDGQEPVVMRITYTRRK